MGTYVPVADWAGGRVGDPEVAAKIDDRLDKNEEYAQDSMDAAREFLDSAQGMLNEFQEPDTDLGTIRTPYVWQVDWEDHSLSEEGLEDVPDSDIDPLALEDLPALDSSNFPALNASPPTYNAPDKPVADRIPDLDEPEKVEKITYPDEPSITFPTPPSLEDIVFPSAPVITIPEFDGELPSEVWDLPETLSYSEPDYGSDIWADLLAKVLNDIRNGGTGLDATVEDELYDRALRRQEAENERLYYEIENYFEARGFDLPPGAMAGRLAEAAREVSRNNTAINAEITINQAELAQKNTHFIIEKGVQLEGMIREFFNQQTNRIFEAAKAIAAIGIDIFNAQVNKFNARSNLYQAQATVFESRVKAALTEAEIFKSQVDSCKVMSDVQENQVNIYKTRIDAIDTIVKVYAAQVEAAKTKAEVERLKTEIFKAQVQAYIARIEANKTKFEVYVAEIEGEKAKATVYSEQVKAYLGEIEAARIKKETKIREIEATIQKNAAEIERYKADIMGYDSQIREVSAKNSKIMDFVKQKVLVLTTNIQAQSAKNTVELQESQIEIEKSKHLLDKAIAKISAAVQGYTALKNLQIAGVNGLMNVGAQLAASAMNAVNTSVAMQHTQGGTETETWSHQDSMSETHPYEEVPASDD